MVDAKRMTRSTRRWHAPFAAACRSMFYPEGTTTDGGTILPFSARPLQLGGLRSGAGKSCSAGLSSRASATQARRSKTMSATGATWLSCRMSSSSWGSRGSSPALLSTRRRVAGKDRFELALDTRDAVIDLYEELSDVQLHRGGRCLSLAIQSRTPLKPNHEEQATCAPLAEARPYLSAEDRQG